MVWTARDGRARGNLMKKIVTGFLVAFFMCGLLAACGKSVPVYVDGEYSASFDGYDARGYRDFVKVTVADGKVTGVVFDAEDKDGNLRSQDEKYREEMEKVQETYPEKYAADLVNQYLEAQEVKGVDALAGATLATDHFTALMTALEENMVKGDTTPVVLEAPPE